MEVAKTPSTSNGYRDEILKRMDERNNKLRPLEGIFTSYCKLTDDLKKARIAGPRNRTFSTDLSNPSGSKIKELQDELADLYKQHHAHHTEYLEANTKMRESEAKLAKIIEEKEKLLADNKRLCAKIAELEHNLKKMKDDNILLNDERLSLSTIVNSQKDKIEALEKEAINLINRIRQQDETIAKFLDAEVQAQEARQQQRVQEEIANAIADTSRDSRANSIISQSDAPIQQYGDMVPTYAACRFDAAESEILDVCWLNVDHFATGGQDKRIRLWRMEQSGKQTKTSTLTGCNAAVTRLDYDTESKAIIASSNDGFIRLWNIDNQRMLHALQAENEKQNVVKFHSNFQAVSGGFDRQIKVWDLRAGRCIKSYFPGSTIHDLIGRCNFGGAAFISGHFDKKLRVYDGRESQPVQIVEMAGKISGLDVAADGRSILCSTRDDTLSLLDIRNLKSVLHIYSADSYRSSSDFARCIISPGMDFVSSGSSNGYVFIWNLNSTKIEKVLGRGSDPPVLAVRWNPTGRGLLSCDKQRNVVLWK